MCGQRSGVFSEARLGWVERVRHVRCGRGARGAAACWWLVCADRVRRALVWGLQCGREWSRSATAPRGHAVWVWLREA